MKKSIIETNELRIKLIPFLLILIWNGIYPFKRLIEYLLF